MLTGECNGLRQHFGPTNVNVWRVAIGAELGQGPEVAERVERQPINLDILGSEDRVTALHFDTVWRYVISTLPTGPHRSACVTPRLLVTWS